VSSTVDLNCDLGEDPTAIERDEALLGLVSSANVACGGHAGSAQTMAHFARAAAARGVALGAHPGYPDREHFGRRELGLGTSAIADAVAAQVLALRTIASREGVALRHVKPHGALYNRAAADPRVAAAIAEGAARVDGRLPIYGLAGSPGLLFWRQAGVPAVAEAFADRRYEADGSLRSRRHDDALITDPADAAAQAVSIATGGWLEPCGGGRLAVEAATLCVHSDTPGSLAVARAVRAALEAAGVAVSAGGA
jgi:UPF0271 protein